MASISLGYLAIVEEATQGAICYSDWVEIICRRITSEGTSGSHRRGTIRDGYAACN